MSSPFKCIKTTGCLYSSHFPNKSKPEEVDIYSKMPEIMYAGSDLSKKLIKALPHEMQYQEYPGH